MTTRIGILGFAHAHVGMYVQQWQTLDRSRVRVVAGWDHDTQRAAESCAALELEQAASVEALLAMDVDAVVIGAETSLHADLVEAAAQAGRAIVLQKPLALTPEQAERIVAAVARADVPFSLAWQMRVDPQNLKMRELVHSGAVGRVYMLRRKHCLTTQNFAGFDDSWHVKPELNRGMWADDAAHAVDFVYWMLGKPVSVMAQVATLRSPKVPDDHGIAVYRYADGTIAEVVSSFVAVAAQNTTEITAEDGVIIQDFGDGVSSATRHPQDAPGLKWFIPGKGWTVADLPVPPNQGERIGALAEPLLQFLERRRPPIATAAEGRDVLGMTLACYESSRLGQTVNLA